ncbi:MAG: nitrate reductase molybdenum cofactor assembly chaperone [Alphaproteobacteria bacterium]
MAQTFKVLSLLLSYPTAQLKTVIPEMRAAIARDALLNQSQRRRLDRLLDSLLAGDLYDLQERYVFLFDRTRTLSLHLFEHIHGESRDRGQAMVDLMAMYEEHGLEIAARELPDHLPLFLEFLSVLPVEEARDMLAQPLHIIAALGARLRKRESDYAVVLEALEDIAAAKPDRAGTDALLAEAEDDPTDLAALDRVWEEEAVTFGGNAGEGACGIDRIRTQVRAAQRRPSQPGAT